jgi:hypothetical protein
MKPRLIQTFLLDGTLEGVRIIELESSIKAFVIPRLKLPDIRQRLELKQPALYLLVNSADNEVYVGESENFLDRVQNHDQNKDFWDTVVAIVSTTNTLEKSDVKYLESTTVERAKQTGTVSILNKTVPLKNTIHEFKLHSLENILADIVMITEMIGFSLFASKQEENEITWTLDVSESHARAQFRGDKFILLADSIISKKFSDNWASRDPKWLAEREELFAKYGTDRGSSVELKENVALRSPNHAAVMVVGRSINAWTTWKNSEGKTMDEVMRKNE